MIEVKNLRKTFISHRKEPGLKGSMKALFKREKVIKEALKSVSFKIQQGEIVGLIGANGAGKTTLVKILAGIVHPTSGEATILGFKPWERDNNYRRQMSLIMGQKAQVWWDLPALDSFLLLKEIYQIEDSLFKKNVEFLADTLMIKDQLKTQVRKLSLGERMKIELMEALHHQPKVIFLDEPTI
jgi:ABC-2 type transport system ATP-binding protein